MSENKIVIPAIPAVVKGKTFSPSDIKWVKTVNDTDTHSAYLPPDNPYGRLIENQNGIFFCLQLNPRFTASLNRVPIGELILLYQRLDDHTKCFTHLVTPIGDNVLEKSPHSEKSPWPGRWVKVIAMTGSKTANSIPVDKTDWPKAGFTGQMLDLSFMTSHVRKIPDVGQLADLQKDIYGRFQPHMITVSKEKK